MKWKAVLCGFCASSELPRHNYSVLACRNSLARSLAEQEEKSHLGKNERIKLRWELPTINIFNVCFRSATNKRERESKCWYLAWSHSSSSNRKMENCCKFKALNRLLPSLVCPHFTLILLACSEKPKTNFFNKHFFSCGSKNLLLRCLAMNLSPS